MIRILLHAQRWRPLCLPWWLTLTKTHGLTFSLSSMAAVATVLGLPQQ